jgi:flavoprotein
MIHLSTYNTIYGQNKGEESKCQFDSWPLKVKNHLDLLSCKGCATCSWKSLDEGYNFALNLTSIENLHKKL